MEISGLVAYVAATNNDIRISHDGPDDDGRYFGHVESEGVAAQVLYRTRETFPTPDEAEKAVRDELGRYKDMLEKAMPEGNPLKSVFG